MKTLELLKKLESYAVFNLATFRRLAGGSQAYARVRIYRLKKAGYVFKLQRGKYTVHKDPFILASRIVWPSYISLWSAIRYYNLTEQLPHDIWVITTRRLWMKKVSFKGSNIIFIHTTPKYFFGYKKITVSNFEVFIAEPEKAILDGLLLKRISFSELAEIVKNNMRIINVKRMVSYAAETKNKALIKRLGYLLDKFGMNYYSKFKRSINNSFIPLEYSLPAKGKKDKKWKIIKNVAVL